MVLKRGEVDSANFSLLFLGQQVHRIPEGSTRRNFNIFSPAGGEEGGIQLDTNYTEESIWYYTNSAADPLRSNGPPLSCLFKVGSQPNRALKSFTNAAPIISIDMCKYRSIIEHPIASSPGPPPPLCRELEGPPAHYCTE